MRYFSLAPKLYLTNILLLFLAVSCGSKENTANAGGDKIPLIYCTDLFHPHDDPDDHFDLASIYALNEFDIKAIILDQGRKQEEKPGSIPVRQMNRITGRDVPFVTGLGDTLTSPADTGVEQDLSYQQGVNTILKVLRESPVPVSIIVIGSLRDVAAAYNRDPGLLHEKIDKLLIFIGEASTDFTEYNVNLDKQAFIAVLRSGLPVWWVPCFDGGLWSNNGHASFWRAGHEELLSGCQPRLIQFFIYALNTMSAEPIGFLDREVDPELKKRLFMETRNLWCTAVFGYVSGRYFVTDGKEYYSIPRDKKTNLKPVIIFDFEETYITVTDDAIVRYEKTENAKKVMRFKIHDINRYPAAMTSATAHLLQQL